MKTLSNRTRRRVRQRELAQAPLRIPTPAPHDPVAYAAALEILG